MSKPLLIGFVLAVALLCLAMCARTETEAADQAADNEDWNQKINTEVSFPLEEQVTVTIWYAANPQTTALTAPENVSVKWLQEQTNIVYEFMPVDMSADPYWREDTFPEAVRTGNLPDLMQESLLHKKDESTRALFADFLEFPELTPNFRRLLEQDQLFLDGSLGRLEGEGALYSLGWYQSSARPFLGVIAYRRDLFEKHELKHESWDELFVSLRYLKQQYPDSYPIALNADSLFHQVPSWFATGFNRLYAWYYNPDSREWTIGPLEKNYEEFVRFLAGLYRENLLHPYSITPPSEEDYLSIELVNDRVFVFPWPGTTGPAFKPLFELYGVEYGDLTETGAWNDQGAWISAMKLPENSSGQRGWITPKRWTSVHSGWLINKKSEYVGELVYLMDYLYGLEATLSIQFGPQEIVWTRDERGTPVLKSSVTDPYAYLRENKVLVGSPVQNLHLGYRDLFGLAQTPQELYFEKHEVGAYFGEGCVITRPAPLVDYEAILNEPPILIVLNRVMRYVKDEVIGFIRGDRPLEEYGDFKAELTRMGAEKLLTYLKQNCIVLTDDMLLSRQ